MPSGTGNCTALIVHAADCDVYHQASRTRPRPFSEIGEVGTAACAEGPSDIVRRRIFRQISRHWIWIWFIFVKPLAILRAGLKCCLFHAFFTTISWGENSYIPLYPFLRADEPCLNWSPGGVAAVAAVIDGDNGKIEIDDILSFFLILTIVKS